MAASAHFFATSNGLRPFWKVGHPRRFDEVESGSLSLRLTLSLQEASIAGSLRGLPAAVLSHTTAPYASRRMSNSHGRHLSAYEIDQT